MNMPEIGKDYISLDGVYSCHVVDLQRDKNSTYDEDASGITVIAITKKGGKDGKISPFKADYTLETFNDMWVLIGETDWDAVGEYEKHINEVRK